MVFNTLKIRGLLHRYFKYNIVLLLVAGVAGCTYWRKHTDLSEGLIEYGIEYVETVQPRYDSNLRPNKMIIKFKNDNTVNRIEGLSGAFSFALIQNLETRVNYILIKLLNKKLVYQEPMQDSITPFTYVGMPPITIKFIDETEDFLGLKCSKAIATYTDSIANSFEILYTKDIIINNPNSNTPFEQIDGVMLKFSVIMFGQQMNITANNIKSTKVSNDDFTIPPDYEEVSREVVEDVVSLLR